MNHREFYWPLKCYFFRFVIFHIVYSESCEFSLISVRVFVQGYSGIYLYPWRNSWTAAEILISWELTGEHKASFPNKCPWWCTKKVPVMIYQIYEPESFLLSFSYPIANSISLCILKDCIPWWNLDLAMLPFQISKFCPPTLHASFAIHF